MACSYELGRGRSGDQCADHGHPADFSAGPSATWENWGGASDNRANERGCYVPRGPTGVSPAWVAANARRAPDLCYDGCGSSYAAKVGEAIVDAATRAGCDLEAIRARLVRLGVADAGLAPSADLPARCGGVRGFAAALGVDADTLLRAARVSAATAARAGLLPSSADLGGLAERYQLGATATGFGPPNPDAPPAGGGVVTLPVTTIEEKMPGSSVGPGGFPGAPGFRPGNWDFTASIYTLASGDTLSGLARLYLPGEPPRWREIWDLNRGRGFTPDNIPLGTKLQMPTEARDRAKALIPTTPSVPSTIGRSVPGAIGAGAAADRGLPTAPGSQGAAVERQLPTVALVLGGLAVVGVGAYALRGRV